MSTTCPNDPHRPLHLRASRSMALCGGREIHVNTLLMLAAERNSLTIYMHRYSLYIHCLLDTVYMHRYSLYIHCLLATVYMHRYSIKLLWAQRIADELTSIHEKGSQETTPNTSLVRPLNTKGTSKEENEDDGGWLAPALLRSGFFTAASQSALASWSEPITKIKLSSR